MKKEKFAYIKSAFAPLYSTPDFYSEHIDEVLCGMQVRIIEEQGNYSRILTHYQYSGWILNKHVCKNSEKMNQFQLLEKKVIGTAFADLQDVPNIQGFTLAVLPRGSIVGLAEEPPQNGWQKVYLCDLTSGYLPISFLSEYYKEPPEISEEALRICIAKTATLYLGCQYRWGGKTPFGVDCSGLCSIAYLLNGITICRDSHIDSRLSMREIAIEKANEGDLLFFPGHVAMLLKNNQYIHSTAGNGNHGVVINSLSPYDKNYRADLPSKLLTAGSIF